MFRLSLEQRLVATLLYFRLVVTKALLSVLFDLDQSSLCRERIGRMRPTLEQVLPLPMQDHLLSSLEDNGSNGSNRRKRVSTLEELLRQYPEVREICIDATEQEIPNPQDNKKSKQHFLGKSHCHTVKTQLTTAGRLVLHTLGGCPGNVADRFVCQASGVLRALNQAGAAQGAAAKRRVRLDRATAAWTKSMGIEKRWTSWWRSKAS